jgi:type I restriction enzyme, S subunit
MKTVSLGEVCSIVMGQAPPGDSYNSHREGLPLIAGAGDFSAGRISPGKFTTMPTKITRAGSIVLSIRASIGAKVWADGEFCLGRGVAGLEPGPLLDPNYLWHSLTFLTPALVMKGRGATFLQVTRDDIADLSMDMPSLEEQRRIAAILDQADALRAKRRQVLAHLDALSRSIFRDMFGDPGEWPDRWSMATIGDAAASVQYGTSAKAGAVGAWPILRMGNITDRGRIDSTDLKYLDLADADISKYTVRRGDLLFNRTNSAEKVGKAAVVRDETPFALAGYLVRVRMRPIADPEFVSAYLGSDHGRAIRRGMAKLAVNQANISASELKKIPIALPPMDLQRRFARLVAKIESQRSRIEASLAKDGELFEVLQSRAFSGQL